MAHYQSSFEDVDYGCGEVAKVAAEFDLEPVSISHIANDPSLARVTFNFTNKLTLSNVKYSTTTDQDVSAWLVLSSAVEGLISSDKTFVPREDCTTTTNELSGTVDIAIKKDTSIRVGGRWSGFEDNPDGLMLPDIGWLDFELSDDFTITPPQNLQVTFPTEMNGEINASIDAWSKNPNITGQVMAEGENWNWLVEVITPTNDIVTRKEFNINSLTASLAADTTGLKPNQSYRVRVTAANEYQSSTSVTSPAIAALPLAPIIRRITLTQEDNETTTATVDWAKPQSGDGSMEIIGIQATGHTEKVEVAQVSDGSSMTGTFNIPNLPPAIEVEIVVSNMTTAGIVNTKQTIYTIPAKTTITGVWDDVRRCITVSATSTNVSSFNMAMGYARGDDSLGAQDGASMLKACDLDHGTGQLIYVSAIPVIPNHTYDGYTATATLVIPNPILGLSKTCGETLNVVDIVETKKGGVMTPRWQTGDRVVKVAPC